MPFKIVETIESGKKQLCIVPSKWESNGEVKWFKKGSEAKLLTDGNSKPGHDWKVLKCNVKKSGIATFEQADEEFELMLDSSNMDMTDADLCDQYVLDVQHNHIIDTLAQQLLNDEQESTSALKNTVARSKNNNNDQIEFIDPELLEDQSFLQNEDTMKGMLNTLINNQKKILRKLADLSDQVENIGQKSAVNLEESNDPGKKCFRINQIESTSELSQLNTLLADQAKKSALMQQLSLLASKSDGKGTTCAYRLLDVLFSRDFLCNYSWSGGSRGNKTKLAFKAYKRVVMFFYDMVTYWDSTYTLEDNENFFKKILKNSLQRKAGKGLRASTSRIRKKASTNIKATHNAISENVED